MTAGTGGTGGTGGARQVEPAYGRAWWAGVAVGGAVIIWGVAGLVRDAAATAPPAWAGWLLGGLAVHDLLVVPAVFAVARAAGHVRLTWRAPVRAALVISGTVVLVTLPALLGDGRSTQPGNTSLLPGNYPLVLAVVLGLIWAVAGAWVLARSLLSLLRKAARHGR